MRSRAQRWTLEVMRTATRILTVAAGCLFAAGLTACANNTHTEQPAPPAHVLPLIDSTPAPAPTTTHDAFPLHVTYAPLVVPPVTIPRGLPMPEPLAFTPNPNNVELAPPASHEPAPPVEARAPVTPQTVPWNQAAVPPPSATPPDWTCTVETSPQGDPYTICKPPAK